MIRITNWLVTICVIFTFSCDVEELLKDSKPPEVSKIYTDATGFIVNPLDTARFWVEATNPVEGNLIYQWSGSGGEFIGSIRTAEVLWRAPLKGDTYTISVDVSNTDETTSRSEQIRVPSVNAPLVSITEPKPDSYLVQNTEVQIGATATHENGILLIRFYANDSLLVIREGSSSETYVYLWRVDLPAGNGELKVEAVANNITETVGGDSISVHIEGVIPGKTHE